MPRAAPAILLAALLLGAAVAGTPGARLPEFPLELVVPGMLGHGLTEMPGGAIGSFDVTVLALQEDLGPGIPLVLVELSGDLIEAIGGVAAGMSGSPVYLPLEGSDALLGGIGYVFADADASVALVTPIRYMREQTVSTHHRGAPSAAALAAGLTRVATPVLVGGLGPRALGLLQRTVLDRSPFGLVAVQAAGGRATDEEAGTLEPGAAVAAQLVRGDLTVSVVGTVTETAGVDVLAFAHPFLGGGSASWPIVAAQVTAVVPSRRLPFKLANVGERVLGAVVQDRPAGVRAELGTAPDLIPVTLTIDAPNDQRTLHLEVSADERLWPALMAVATLEAVDRTWQRIGPGTADVAWEIELPGGPDLRMGERTAHAADLAMAAARLAMAPLTILAENAFESPRPAAVRMVVTLDERRSDAEVVELVVPEGAHHAGDVIELIVRLQPWRRASEIRTQTVRLPRDLEGELELRARGGSVVADDEELEEDPLRSYGELLTALRERPGGADLVFEVRAAGGAWRELARLSLAVVVQGERRGEVRVETADGMPGEGDALPDHDDGGVP